MTVKTLLVLGSKPDPALPERSGYSALACANGSGYSADKHRLPAPEFTVMSAILTSVASGRQSLKHIKNLKTGTLYYYPRPPSGKSILKQALQLKSNLLTRPYVLRIKLKSIGYKYSKFIDPGYDYYAGLIRSLCDNDPQTMLAVNKKQPSTGIMALLLGLQETSYERFILSGFSLELTHAYGRNPEIDQRGTVQSRHSGTDAAVLAYVAKKYGNIYTTEQIIAARAGLPILS